MGTTTRPPAWKTLLAFAIIYFVWGSTFLAIRVGVREVPPLILAAMRFFAAGLVLYIWMRARGERSPTPRQWRSAMLLGIVIFLFDYGLLFWSEMRVPSGIAAVMLATKVPAVPTVSSHAVSHVDPLRALRSSASGLKEAFRVGLFLLIGTQAGPRLARGGRLTP